MLSSPRMMSSIGFSSRQPNRLAFFFRISARNIRRDGNETAKKLEKDSVINEDELKDVLDKIQKLTDEYIKKLDGVCAEKEKEIMTV